MFLEDEFIRLSDKRNLFSIFLFDSNSYKFITLKLLKDFIIDSNFSWRLDLTFIFILFEIKLWEISSLYWSKLLSDSIYQLLANLLQSSISSITIIVSSFIYLMRFDGFSSIIPKYLSRLFLVAIS